MRFFFTAALALATAVVAEEFVCSNPTVADSTTAGENGDVKVELLECGNQSELKADTVRGNIRFDRRQAGANVCGNQCAHVVVGI